MTTRSSWRVECPATDAKGQDQRSLILPTYLHNNRELGLAEELLNEENNEGIKADKARVTWHALLDSTSSKAIEASNSSSTEDNVGDSGVDKPVKSRDVYTPKLVVKTVAKKSSVEKLDVSIQPVTAKADSGTSKHSVKNLCKFWESKKVVPVADRAAELVSSTTKKGANETAPEPEVKIHEVENAAKDADGQLPSKICNPIPTKSARELIEEYSNLINKINSQSPDSSSFSDKPMNVDTAMSDDSANQDMVKSRFKESIVDHEVRDSANHSKTHLDKTPSTRKSRKDLALLENNKQENNTPDTCWIKTPSLKDSRAKSDLTCKTSEQDRTSCQDLIQKTDMRYSKKGKTFSQSEFSLEMITPSPKGGGVTPLSKKKPRKLMSLDPSVYSKLFTPPSSSSRRTSLDMSSESHANDTSVWTDSELEKSHAVCINKRTRNTGEEHKDIVNISDISPIMSDSMVSETGTSLFLNESSLGKSNASCHLSTNKKSLGRLRIAEAVCDVVQGYMDVSSVTESVVSDKSVDDKECNVTDNADAGNYEEQKTNTSRQIGNNDGNKEEFSSTSQTVEQNGSAKNVIRENNWTVDSINADGLSANTKNDVLNRILDNVDHVAQGNSSYMKGKTEMAKNNDITPAAVHLLSFLFHVEEIEPVNGQISVIEVTDNIGYASSENVTDLDAYAVKGDVPTLKTLCANKMDCKTEAYVSGLPDCKKVARKMFIPLKIDAKNGTQIDISEVSDRKERNLLKIAENGDSDIAAVEVEKNKEGSDVIARKIFDPCFSPDLECHELLETTPRIPTKPSVMCEWSPTLDEDTNPDSITEMTGDNLKAQTFPRGSKSKKRPRRLEFDEGPRETDCSGPKLPRTPVTEHQFEFIVELEIADQASKDHCSVEYVASQFDDESSGESRRNNSDTLSATSYGSLNDQFELNTCTSMSQGAQTETTFIAVKCSEHESNYTYPFLHTPESGNSSSTSASSHQNITWPVYPQFPPLYSPDSARVQSLTLGAGCGYEINSQGVQCEKNDDNVNASLIHQGSDTNTGFYRDGFSQLESVCHDSPQVAVLQEDSSEMWKEITIGSATFSPEPSSLATQYANYCCDSATQSYAPYQEPAVYLDEANRQSRSCMYGNVNDQVETNKDILIELPANASQVSSDDFIKEETLQFQENFENAVISDTTEIEADNIGSSEMGKEQNKDMMTMVEENVRKKLQGKICQRKQALGGTELCDSLKKIRPYIISGWLSTTYLMALARKEDLINDLFNNPLDENGDIHKWILQSCNITKPEILARDLVFRLFTLSELQKISLNLLARTRRYKAIKKAVLQIFNRKTSRDTWNRKCVPFIKVSIQTLFKQRVKIVQNFFLLHAS